MKFVIVEWDLDVVFFYNNLIATIWYKFYLQIILLDLNLRKQITIR